MRVKPSSFILNSNHPLADGLIRSWPLGEGSGSIWADYSGNNKPVTVVNHAEASWVETEFGWGYKFNGSDQHGAAEGHELTSYTHAVFVIPNSVSDQPISTMAESPGSTTTDRLLLLLSSKWVHYLFDGGSKTATSSTSGVSGLPVVLGATSDGSNMGIWVNGTREANPAAGSAFTGYTTPEYIFARGKNAIAGSTIVYSNPTIIGAHIWNRVLSASEMALLAEDFWSMYRLDFGWCAGPVSLEERIALLEQRVSALEQA